MTVTITKAAATVRSVLSTPKECPLLTNKKGWPHKNQGCRTQEELFKAFLDFYISQPDGAAVTTFPTEVIVSIGSVVLNYYFLRDKCPICMCNFR